jgi:hypothetical protein
MRLVSTKRIFAILFFGFVLLCSVAGTACDPLFKSEQERLGVSINTRGEVVIVGWICTGDRLVSAALVDPSSVSEDGSGTKRTYWRVRPIDDITSGLFTIPVSPEPPDGFELATTPPEDLESDSPILATVGVEGSDGRPQGAAKEFLVSELQVNKVMARSDYLSPEEFQEAAASSCPDE